MNTGEVVAGDPSAGHGFVTGDAVNLAKRIEQAAAPGEILIGETTSHFVGHAIVSTAREPLSAKGKRADVLAYRVDEVDLTSEALPRRLDAPMVGRGEELATLLAAYTRAVDTRKPQLITVLGLPGIGKSRLARELLEGVASEARVLVGRCLPYGEGITFWPVREILPNETFEGTREEIFWRIRKQLEAFAAERPLVVCFEDVHWGEPTFLDLVQYLKGWIPEGPVLLLCLARPELLENRPDWPRNEPEATALTLDPLSDEESAQLLELLDAPDAARGRIAEAAEGNPLFVEQMTAMTADEGADVAVPPSIQAVLAARLDSLERDDGTVLQCAAVVGRDFSLRAVLELVPAELRPAATTVLLGFDAKGAHPTPYGRGRRRLPFPSRAHPRCRVRRDAQGLSFRAAREARELARRRFATEDVLVGYHLEQAVLLRRELGARDDEVRTLAMRAADALHGVGRRAHARGDAPAAASLLERSVALLSKDDPGRPALLVELADAQMRIGQFARTEEALDEATRAAVAAGDRRTEIRATVGRRFVRVFMPSADPEPVLSDEAIIAELERLHDDFGLARAWRVLSEADAGACRWAARADALERALSYAAQFPEQRHEANVIATLLVQALHFGPTPATQTVQRCRDLLGDGDADLPLQAGIKATLGAVLATQGELADARKTYAESAALHDDLGLRVRRAVGTIFAAEIEILGDDPAAAERELLHGYQTLEAMGTTLRAVVAAYLADALWLQGRFEEAAYYAAVSAETADQSDIAAQTLERTTRARLLAARGETTEAETVAGEAVALAEPTDSLALQAAAALALADILAADGREEESRAHVERARDLYEIKQNVVAAGRLAARIAIPATKA